MPQIPPQPIRKPPPPPPLVRQPENEGGKLRPEMPVGNRDDEKRRTSIDSLSDDDLITILVKLPAQDIHNAGRLVCRRWYLLIRSPEFTHTHLQRSPAGILIQCKSNYEVSPSFVGMSGGRIKTYKLGYNFTDTVLSTCNGLILQYDCLRHILLVVNPATKQQCFIPTYQKQIYCNEFTCLGYVAASKVYKLVHANNLKQCDVLTVGVDDTWRHLSTDHLSNNNIQRLVATEGFVHWVNFMTERLVSLDLENETISEVPIPEGLGWCDYFSTGKCVSFVSWLWPKEYCWEVWEMRPGPVVEWDKLLDVDLEGKSASFGNCSLKPVGWIKYKQVLLFQFCSTSKFFAYNVCTKGIELLELDFPYVDNIMYAAHTNSLVRLDESTFKTD